MDMEHIDESGNWKPGVKQHLTAEGIYAAIGKRFFIEWDAGKVVGVDTSKLSAAKKAQLKQLLVDNGAV